MDEKGGHLVSGVRHKGVSPHYDGTEHGAIGKAEAGGEEPAPDGLSQQHVWQPQVEQDQQVGEVAEVKEEVVIAQLLVGVPAVGDESEAFLNKGMIIISMINCFHDESQAFLNEGII